MLAILHDLAAATLAWIFAYWLRFNFEPPPHFVDEMLHTLTWVVPLQGIIFWHFGLYRGLWRYASVVDLRRISLALLTAAALIPLTIWMFRISAVVPRSVLVIDPILLLLMMGGSRFAYRLWREHSKHNPNKLGEPVLVLGAGDAAVALSKELNRSREWHLVGFLDDDITKHGRDLNEIKVLGALDSLPQWAARLNVKQAIIAIPSATHQIRKHIVALCNQAAIKVLTVPSFDDLLSGRIAISQLRAVELDDLLGRDPVKLDNQGLHHLLTDKVVLITGAGGSIGSELCRQIARFQPQTLMLFERNEFALYKMEQEFSAYFPNIRIVCLIGDVGDAARLEQVFTEHRPAVVFHAAAYKHVPLMEQHNAWQAIRNNVLGTWSVATTAQRHGVEKFVFISTDKAVNPTNVMGASKRLAEMVCQGL
ncbi:MAG: SDR family NAD(P)-dependent oxidoreductase, partial [Candidatus Nitrotoga sp.]